MLYPNNHDTIFYYTGGGEFAWNRPFIEYDLDNLDEKTEAKYCHQDADGRKYTLGDLTNPNPNRPNLTYEFLGHKKVWRWTKDRMQEAYETGLVVQPSPGAVPRVKRYLDEQEGKSLDDVWTDIALLKRWRHITELNMRHMSNEIFVEKFKSLQTLTKTI